MDKITITEPFEQPLRWVVHDGEPGRFAVATLYLEPLQTEAVEYVIALPPGDLLEEVHPAYITAVGEGVHNFAEDNEVVGLRVTLTDIRASAIDSSAHAFQVAAQKAMHQAMKTHGVPAPPFPGKISV